MPRGRGRSAVTSFPATPSTSSRCGRPRRSTRRPSTANWVGPRNSASIPYVYLHDLLYAADADGFLGRIDRFLDLRAHMASARPRPLRRLLEPGRKARPAARKPGIHNSGWVQSPGVRIVNDPRSGLGWMHVQGVIGAFAQDERILFWDLYNEPGNNQQGARSLPLLKQTFAWAREASPSQPLTAGIWFDNEELNAFQLAASDLITFHNYNDAADLQRQIDALRAHGRPLICTEWLRRGHSEVAECLPVFHKERVGCINWGLVSGKTQTIFAWTHAYRRYGAGTLVPRPAAPGRHALQPGRDRDLQALHAAGGAMSGFGARLATGREAGAAA